MRKKSSGVAWRIKDLEKIIFQLSGVSLFTKQCIVWLLAQTVVYRGNVCIGLLPEEGAHEVIMGIERMHHHFQIIELFDRAGLRCFPMYYRGYFSEEGFNPSLSGAVILVSTEDSNSDVWLLNPDFAEIASILPHHG